MECIQSFLSLARFDRQITAFYILLLYAIIKVYYNIKRINLEVQNCYIKAAPLSPLSSILYIKLKLGQNNTGKVLC